MTSSSLSTLPSGILFGAKDFYASTKVFYDTTSSNISEESFHALILSIRNSALSIFLYK